MAGLIYARPLVADDFDALAELDQEYSLTFEVEPALTRGSISFYSRSGHAFVAATSNGAAGFVLAHAIFNGTRPALLVSRLATMTTANDEALAALVSAVVKSAYDAAVYDLLALVPGGDAAARAALEQRGFRGARVRVYERVLGSRGAGLAG